VSILLAAAAGTPPQQSVTHACVTCCRLHEVKVLDTSWYLPPMGEHSIAQATGCTYPAYLL